MTAFMWDLLESVGNVADLSTLEINPYAADVLEHGTEHDLVQFLMDHACHVLAFDADSDQYRMETIYGLLARRALIHRFRYDS